jgi:hypothetical protein
MEGVLRDLGALPAAAAAPAPPPPPHLLFAPSATGDPFLSEDMRGKAEEIERHLGGLRRLGVLLSTAAAPSVPSATPSLPSAPLRADTLQLLCSTAVQCLQHHVETTLAGPGVGGAGGGSSLREVSV